MATWIWGMAMAGPAHASFHTWMISELYSNADGTVQFVELHESAGLDGQNFLAGHALTSSRGGTVHTFAFPANLPVQTTANKTFLVGTPAYAALNVAAPDYMMPAGFLFTDGGVLDFAAVDSIVYGALPLDGVQSLGRNGVAAVNSPTNFHGNTGSISNATPVERTAAVGIPAMTPGALLVTAVLLAGLALLRRMPRARRRHRRSPV